MCLLGWNRGAEVQEAGVSARCIQDHTPRSIQWYHLLICRLYPAQYAFTSLVTTHVSPLLILTKLLLVHQAVFDNPQVKRIYHPRQWWVGDMRVMKCPLALALKTSKHPGKSVSHLFLLQTKVQNHSVNTHFRTR
jgi:hypothetical protein